MKVAGAHFSLTPKNGKRDTTVSHFYDQFYAGRGPADIHLQFRLADLSRSASFPSVERKEILFQVPGHWQLFRQPDGSFFFEGFNLKNGRCDLMALLDSGLQGGEALLRPKRRGVWYPAELMHPLGILLLTHHIAQSAEGGVLCHGSAVDDNGRGLLFIAPSGTGKTTLSRFWQDIQGAVILGDDRIILRKEEGRYWLYATPWVGELGYVNNHRVPLDRICLLQQASKHEWVKESEPVLLQKLFVNTFFPFWDPETVQQVLEFFGQLVSHVPVVSLRFAKSPDIVDFIRKEP